MTGIELIAEERKRQVEVEGWTGEHDDKYDFGILGMAASCYDRGVCDEFWPWDKRWWKPSTVVRNKVKAGALYQAEVDRIIRNKMSTHWTDEYQERIQRIAKEIDLLQNR